MLIEGWHYQHPRLGETLAPAARPVLSRLGLLETTAATSTPSFGNESAWGGPELDALPFVFNPHGAGWHLDRPRFDSLLADAAVAAGALRAAGTPVTGCLPGPNGTWRIATGTGCRAREMTARSVIDATGRRASVACSVGARRLVQDRMVGIGVQCRGNPEAGGPTMVEATPEGWWYSAPLPPDRLMVMLMTDADLCRAGGYTRSTAWNEALAGTVHTRKRVSGLEHLWTRPRLASAASHRLVHGTGTGRWLAAGDAAMAVDPLAGDGILRALVTGEAAALAMVQWLAGRPEAAHAYERGLDARFARYSTERRLYYALETRWPSAPFWRRRLPSPPRHGTATG
jgi:flavin-dependent dehydrogenase